MQGRQVRHPCTRAPRSQITIFFISVRFFCDIPVALRIPYTTSDFCKKGPGDARSIWQLRNSLTFSCSQFVSICPGFTLSQRLRAQCSLWGARICSALVLRRQSPYTRTVIFGKILTHAPTRSVLDTPPPNTEYLLPPILHQRYLRTEQVLINPHLHMETVSRT